MVVGGTSQVFCSPDTTHSISQDPKYGSGLGGQLDLAGALAQLALFTDLPPIPVHFTPLKLCRATRPKLGILGSLNSELRVGIFDEVGSSVFLHRSLFLHSIENVFIC